MRARKALSSLFLFFLLSIVLLSVQVREVGVHLDAQGKIGYASSKEVVRDYHIPTASYTININGTIVYAINDSTTAIDYRGTSAARIMQNAIDALNSAGGLIFLKEGLYVLTTTVFLKDNIALIGAGNSVILRRGNNVAMPQHRAISFYYPLIDISNVCGATVKDLRIDGNEGNNAPQSTDGANINLLVYNSSNVLIENVYSFNPTGDGLNLYNSRHIFCRNVTLISSYMVRFGGLCIGGTTDSYFEDIFIQDFNHGLELFCPMAGGTLYVGPNSYLTFVNLKLVRTAYSSTSRISMIHNTTDTTFYNLVSYTTNAALKSGFKITGGERITFIGGRITGGSNYPAFFIEETSRVTRHIEDILFRGVRFEGGSYNVVLYNGTRITFENCSFLPPFIPQNQFVYLGRKNPYNNTAVDIRFVSCYFGDLGGPMVAGLLAVNVRNLIIEKSVFDNCRPLALMSYYLQESRIDHATPYATSLSIASNFGKTFLTSYFMAASLPSWHLLR